jgi:TolA-binding protein
MIKKNSRTLIPILAVLVFALAPGVVKAETGKSSITPASGPLIRGTELKTTDLKVNTKEDINKVFEVGVKAYDGQKYEDAIEIFRKITDKFPGYGDAHYYIGLSYFGLGKYYQAIASFLEANKIFGKNKLDALFGAGLSYLSSGYTDEARTAFQKVIKESTDLSLVEDAKNWINSIDEQILQKEKLELLTTDLSFREGIQSLDAQLYQDAEKAFRRSLQDKPGSVLSLYYLGNTLYLLEKYDESIETFEKVILIEPDSKIAEDARLYIRAIEEITAALPNSRPYFFQAVLGALYDSNLSYADQQDTIISDIAGNANLSAGYVFNNNFQAQYNYYGSLFSGINDQTPGLTIHSYDFNLQRHTANAKFNYTFFNNLLSEVDYNLSWYILGGNSFLFNNRITPKLNFYLSPNLITVLQYSLDINSYPVFKTRDSVDHSIDLSQYLYLFNNSLWFRLGYNFQKINANDQLQKQSGLLTDGNKYDLEYNFTNSLSSNDFSLDVGFNNLFYNSKLRLNGKLSLNNYDNPDIYKLTSPITNITTGETEIKVIKEKAPDKKRFDLLYSVGLTYSIPVYTNLTASLTYSFLVNNSNITPADYIGRSYVKHLLGLNLTYEF